MSQEVVQLKLMNSIQLKQTNKRVKTPNFNSFRNLSVFKWRSILETGRMLTQTLTHQKMRFKRLDKQMRLVVPKKTFLSSRNQKLLKLPPTSQFEATILQQSCSHGINKKKQRKERGLTKGTNRVRSSRSEVGSDGGRESRSGVPEVYSGADEPSAHEHYKHGAHPEPDHRHHKIKPRRNHDPSLVLLSLHFLAKKRAMPHLGQILDIKRSPCPPRSGSASDWSRDMASGGRRSRVIPL